MSIEVLNIEKLTNERFLNLFRATYRKDGETFQWDFASRNKEPRCDGNCPSNAVVVIAYVTMPQTTPGLPPERKLLVTKEWRVPLGGWMWGFVAGLHEGGDIEKEVARELFEEANVLLKRVIAVSPPTISSGGMSDEASTMVIVEAALPPGETVSNKNQERQEKIEPFLLGYDAICDLAGSRLCLISARAWPVFHMIRERGRV